MNGTKDDGIFPKECSETTPLLRAKKHEKISIPSPSGSSIFKLFRFASRVDILLMTLGTLLSTIHGACFPVLALIFGQMTNTFIGKQYESLNVTLIKPGEYTDYNNVESLIKFSESMSDYTTAYLYLALGVFICAFGQTTCWELTAERQAFRLRKAFFAQLLRQDITWHEKAGAGQDLTTRLNDDLDRLREGLGCKIALVNQYSSTFISGIVVGLLVNWRLTLVILIAAPFMIGSTGYIARLAATSAKREQLKYAQAGAVADETLAAIKTVAAFNGFHRMIKRYEAALEAGRVEAMKKYRRLSICVGFSFFTTYVSYGFAFWYSSYLINIDMATPGSVFCVFFAVMAGAFSIGNALPFLQAIGTAIGVCGTIFEVLDRTPQIDAISGEGLRPEIIQGEVRFENVHFIYPARPETPALRGIDLIAEPGKTIALVGPSGAGKSSVISLLLRFFDSTDGRILVNNYDIRDMDVSWLRKNIGFVSQEPVLFGATILENILFGHPNATREDALQACKLANAHGFISRLPLRYDTPVGERGAQLSGGQKQRLAIARALIRRPPILLLDEATSALDAKSEASVQKALNIASQGRTTIIVAHRLSTIRHADKIYVLREGRIVETGNHETLLKMDGLYAELAKMQQAESATEEQTIIESQDSLLQSSMEVVNNKDSRKIIGGICCDEEPLKAVGLNTLLKLNRPEWILLTAGVICCCCTGTIMPVFAFFYGEMFTTLTLHGEALRLASMFWSEMFMVLACASMIAYTVQLWCMTSAAEYLIKRIRLFAFQNILRQPVGWYDLPSSAVGKLVVRLAREAPLIKGAAGLRFGQVLGAVVTLVAALLIAFAFGWKLALFLVLAVPIIIAAYNQQTNSLKRTQNRDQLYIDEAGRIASECVVNIRTVHSLGAERTFSTLYNTNLEIPYSEGIRQSFIYGLVFSFSQSVIYVMYAGAFWMGTYLIEHEEMIPSDVYRVFFALAFCAASIGQTSAYQQDYQKARQAASLMVALINRKPEIDSSTNFGLCPEIRGKIEFQNVRFRYPSRPEVEVLRGFNLTLPEGRTVALVGASGSGKSTIVSLLERFYQPCNGKILIDGFDITSLNIPNLRKSIGLVTQEPTLFAATIRENLAYGVEDDQVEMEDIIDAAKLANAHEFIINLPLGYETHVGERGTQLSGGQKQRIAIARALIKKPPIILLDEATSALDAKSESIVQEALNAASHGRTTLIVAHRLATIRNADEIAVVHNGQVVELGNHEKLVAKQGRYYNLVKSQGLL